MTLVTVAQPCWTLHQAEGWAGMSPLPFHEPPPMRHQLPTPSRSVVGIIEIGKAEEQMPKLVAQTPIRQSSGMVR